MMIEVGKLYSCSKYFLMLYPDKDAAAAADSTFVIAAVSIYTAAYWSRKLGKPVIYADKNIPLLVLNTEGEYVEVLAGDKVGWAICQDWLEIKEITDDAT